MGKDDDLERLLAESRKRVAAMNQEELAEMLKAQRDIWGSAEMGWPKPEFKLVDGVKVYASYADYCNG